MRIAGTQGDLGLQAATFAFFDLRFADGHVERWLGPGRATTVDATEAGLGSVQEEAVETAAEFAFDIACDIARDYAMPRPPEVDGLPCEEVVVEWRARPVDLGGCS